MLKQIRELIAAHSDSESFFILVNRHFPKSSADYQLIQVAYNTAENEFKLRQREDGDQYFQHLLATAIIVMEVLRVKDAEIIAASLLHDIIEDIKGWHEGRIAMMFSPRVAELTKWVTKMPIADFDNDKEARDRAYHQNLHRAPREALIIKLADRLHNLLTLWETEDQKRRRKVRETQDFYLSLAEKEILLIHELESALDEVMNDTQHEGANGA